MSYQLRTSKGLAAQKLDTFIFLLTYALLTYLRTYSLTSKGLAAKKLDTFIFLLLLASLLILCSGALELK